MGSVKRKTSFMLVHQKIQLSSNSVEHNHISHQLKKGNHDLLHYLNWILFLTVMLWLSGIMIFVVSSNQQGTEVEMNRPFLEDNRMSKIRHKYSQIKIQIDSQKATLDSLNQNLTHFKNASVI